MVVAVPVDVEATIPNTDSTTVVEDILNTDISILVVVLVDVVVEVAKINLVIS
jgi:hypothetical protein